MPFRIEDDIVQRALIALLTPEIRGLEPERNNKQNFEETCRGSRRIATPARISIVEQPTAQTLTVCWSDPLSGHYADQLWRKGVAQKSSFCVLTGMRIRRGDAVFRPRTGERCVPVNREYMLLANAVPQEASLVT